MKKILIIIAFLLPLIIWAQDDDKKKKKDEVARLKEEVKVAKQEVKDTVAFFNSHIVLLNDSIKQLNDSIGKQDKQHAQDLVALDDSVQKAKDNWAKEAELREKLAIELAIADKKLEALNTLNDIIYRQCLLYPMEGRYNAEDVNEAKQCLIGLGLWDNDKYKNMTVYRDLLDNYGRYNQEIIDFMERQGTNNLKRKGWLTSETVGNNIIDDMKQQLEYYPFYEKRNDPPFQSILYLDDVLTDYIKLIKTNGTITEESYQDIINRLKQKETY